jgi:hypothetical protein
MLQHLGLHSGEYATIIANHGCKSSKKLLMTSSISALRCKVLRLAALTSPRSAAVVSIEVGRKCSLFGGGGRSITRVQPRADQSLQ